jgi:riboflavin synthase
MFTGIIESLATVKDVIKDGTNLHLLLESPLVAELKVDQSVAHNGICLTVVACSANEYKVTAVAETIEKTNLGGWQKGNMINIERSLRLGDRLDGHFVQGHVDTTATCIEKKTLDGSWQFRFRFEPLYAPLIIEKGSICLNGVSLTIFNIGKDEFTVAIIPYTFEHTNFRSVQEGSVANLEFDVLGKYLLRRADLQL